MGARACVWKITGTMPDGRFRTADRRQASDALSVIGLGESGEDRQTRGTDSGVVMRVRDSG